MINLNKMKLFTWKAINFEDILENDFIRSDTSPVSQRYIGHLQADRQVEGRVLSKGNTPESSLIDFDGEIVPLAYDLGNDVIISFQKGTFNVKNIWDRESGKRHKLHFGSNDILYLRNFI